MEKKVKNILKKFLESINKLQDHKHLTKKPKLMDLRHLIIETAKQLINPYNFEELKIKEEV